MLKYKQLTIERLVCACDRCNREMEKGTTDIEWQERFALSFRAGYGSVFGDGNYVEGDFCQECIQQLLGRWLRVTDDDPFESRYKSENEPQRILQSGQHDAELKNRGYMSQIAAIIRETDRRAEQREMLAKRLGIANEQVVQMALDYLAEATKPAESGELADGGSAAETVK